MFLATVLSATASARAQLLVNGDFEVGSNGWTWEGEVNVGATPGNDFASFEENPTGDLSRIHQVFSLSNAPGTLSFRYFLGSSSNSTGWPIPPKAGWGSEERWRQDLFVQGTGGSRDGSWVLLPPRDSFSAFLLDPVTLERLLPPPAEPPADFDDFFFADNTGAIDFNSAYVTVSPPDADGSRVVTLDISSLAACQPVRLEFGLAGFPDGSTTIAAVDDVGVDSGASDDCNGNGMQDACDIAAGTSTDCDSNGVADECDPDCNTNGRPDPCDIALGLASGGRSAAHDAYPALRPELTRRGGHSAFQGQPSITLAPLTSTGPVGSFHTLTALLTDGGAPVIGVLVTFEASSGPNAGVLGTDVTDPDGEATLAYVGIHGEGTDQVVSSFFNGSMTQFSDTVTRTWLGSLDCNFNTIPDECEGFSAPAATLLGGVSRRLHGGSVGEDDITINIAGRVEDHNVTSDPRRGGITELRLQFDIPPGGPGIDPVAIHDQACPGGTQGDYQLYAGSSTTTPMIEGTELVLVFTPVLANERTYRITVGPGVTGVPCQSIEVRGLAGDASSDGQVNATDRSFEVGVWTGSGYSANTDIDANGATNATDRSHVVGIWTGTQNCAP